MVAVRAVDSDEALLATLGYKQEFKRAFKPLEVSRVWTVCSCTSRKSFTRFSESLSASLGSYHRLRMSGFRALLSLFTQLLCYLAVLCFQVQYPMEELYRWCGVYVVYLSLSLVIFPFIHLPSGLSGRPLSCALVLHLASWRRPLRRQVGYVSLTLCLLSMWTGTDTFPAAVLPDVHLIIPSLSQHPVLDCRM